jgi:purine-binding chemotaxis protein CheW
MSTVLESSAPRTSSSASVAGRSLAGSPSQAMNHHLGGEFLTFRLGGEEYGIEILRVQEIRSYEQPTRIANSAGLPEGRREPARRDRADRGPAGETRTARRPTSTAFTVVIVLNIRGPGGRRGGGLGLRRAGAVRSTP